MAIDPKALLKGFGAGVDVVSQIATDKAVNARRNTPSTFDITKGVLVEFVVQNGPNWYPHSLGRIPQIALVGKSVAAAPQMEVTDFRATQFQVWANATSSQPIRFWLA